MSHDDGDQKDFGTRLMEEEDDILKTEIKSYNRVSNALSACGIREKMYDKKESSFFNSSTHQSSLIIAHKTVVRFLETLNLTRRSEKNNVSRKAS